SSISSAGDLRMRDRQRDTTPQHRSLSNSDLSVEAWETIPRFLRDQKICHLEGLLGPLDVPRLPNTRPRLTATQIRDLQSELIRLVDRLDNSAIQSLLPAAAREARTTTIRTRIRGFVDAAVQCIRDNPDAAANSIPFSAEIERNIGRL